MEITSRTILFTVGLILFLFFLWNITDLFINLFIAFILMSSLKPLVDWLEQNRIPRALSSILVLLVSMGLIMTLLYLALPPLLSQTIGFFVYLSRELMTLLQRLDTQLTPRDILDQIPAFSQQLPNLTNIVYRTLYAFFGNILNIISVFFFTLYFLLGINKLEELAGRFLNRRQSEFFMETLRSVEKQLGAWMRAEFMLMLLIGLMSYVGLSILNVRYALPLAVIAGILEIFPIIGPTLSLIPAFFVAATSSWVLGLAVIGLYILIQQLENNLVVPLVMKKAVGIPPLAVLISVYIGQRLAGIYGIVLAVPLVATLVIIAKEIYKYREPRLSEN